MTPSEFLDLIQKLVLAHAPSGHEAEVDAVLQAEFGARCEAVSQDAAGNLIAYLPGRQPGRAVGITAHKDEIGMIVKRVDPSGRLSVRQIGGAQPWVYGEGVVDVLGDREVVSGILSFGTRHVSDESPHHAFRSVPVTWEGAWIETKLSPAELQEKGIHVGTKAVIGRHRKQPFRLGPYLAGYALDCKVAAAILVYLLDQFQEEPPARDTYLVATSQEEVGIQGAAFFARTHALETLIAIEVGPVADEYQTVNDGRPILLYQDATFLYSEGLTRDLAAAGQRLGIDTQYACVTNFGSDASVSYRYGYVPQAACIGYPTENTHGFEIAHLEGIENTAKLLAEYLRQG
jgi:putative aminopeptidase FrvX